MVIFIVFHDKIGHSEVWFLFSFLDHSALWTSQVIGGSEVEGGPRTVSFNEAFGIFKSEKKKKMPKQASETAIF